MGSSYTIRSGPDRIGIYVGPLPERKRHAICEVVGNAYRPLAYFSCEDGARCLNDVLTMLFREGGARIAEVE